MTPFNSVSHCLGLSLLVRCPRVHCYETLPKSVLPGVGIPTLVLQFAHPVVCETLPFRACRIVVVLVVLVVRWTYAS
eukprot:2225978-Rhodomonas_salina.1